MKSTRDAFGEALVALADEGLNFVVVDGGVSAATRTHLFERKYPDRFLNCGISEQNLVSVAAGLASSGVPAVAVSFAGFLINRAFDQIRLQVAQAGLDVKLVGSHGGITAGPDGISAHAIEDLALTTALPGVCVAVPADAEETAAVLRTAITTPGPFYLRVSKHKTPTGMTADPRADPWSTRVLRAGSDLTVVTHGVMVSTVLAAAGRLDDAGVSIEVLNASWLRPFDDASLVASASRTGRVLVVTEHLAEGGLVGVVTAVLGRRLPVPVDWVALDAYAGSAPADDLLEGAGLTAERVEAAALALCAASGHPRTRATSADPEWRLEPDGLGALG